MHQRLLRRTFRSIRWAAAVAFALCSSRSAIAEDSEHHFELPGMIGTFNNGPGQKVSSFPIDRLTVAPGGLLFPAGASLGSPLTISQPGPVTIFDPGTIHTVQQLQQAYRAGSGVSFGTSAGSIGDSSTVTTIPTVGDINAAFGATPQPYDVIAVTPPPGSYTTAVNGVFQTTNTVPGVTSFNSQHSGLLRSTGTEQMVPLNQPLATGDSLQAFYAYDYVTSLSVPTPSGDGLFGRSIVSQNNSPLPRDRVYFDYSLLSNNLPVGGPSNFSRYTLGMEKVITGGLSFEVRFPFAATLSDQINLGSGIASNSAEMGNAMFVIKQLLAYSEDTVLTGGLAFSAPTASGISVVTPAGVPVLRFGNRATHLKPFLAAAIMPNENFFLSSFLELDVPVGSDPVFLNTDGSGIRRVSQLRNASHIFCDLQAGYWLPGSDHSVLRRWAPLLELHSDYGLGDSSTVSGSNYRIIDVSDNRRVLNMLVGTAFDFHHGRSLLLGYGTGIGGDGSQSNGEFLAILNWPFVFH